MNSDHEEKNRRILVVDDNASVHEDFRKVLLGIGDSWHELDELEKQFLNKERVTTPKVSFELDSAFQGKVGLDKIREARRENRPYAVVFIDVRMPPGWDGVETLARIWKEEPDIQAVICSAYSDYAAEDLIRTLDPRDRMVFLRKPFDMIEVRQVAFALTEKWNLAREVQKRWESLKERERALATLMSNLPGMAYRFHHTPERKAEFVSEGAYELTGYTPSEFSETPNLAFGNLAHEDDTDRVSQQINSAIRRKKRFQTIYRLHTKNGALKWVWEQGQGVFSHDGDLLAIEGFVTDITQRKLAEEALRESEEYLSITLDSIGDAVIATDSHGRIERINPVAESLTGWTFSEAVGRHLSEVLTIVQNQTVGKTQGSEDQSRAIKSAHNSSDTILIAKDGTQKVISQNISPILGRDGSIRGRVLVFRDMSAQRTMEEQLRQARTLEAVGQLAGGVAHDFNNLLGGILGLAEMLRRNLEEGSSNRQKAEEICQTAERAAKLTSRLLLFARKRESADDKPYDLHKVLEEALRLLKSGLDPRIRVVTKFEAPDAVIICDPAQLQNAFLNLCINARDALPKGGEMILSTKLVNIGSEHTLSISHPLESGSYICASIRDTGVGMSPEVKERIFEPFFTTKDIGKGTGLGLASVYGYVGELNGSIEVRSELGSGSEFSIYLPLADGMIHNTSFPPPSELPLGLRARVLVADDDDTIRSVAQMALETLGHEVHLCSDGEEAVAFYEKHYEQIDLVILDNAMPKMSGLDAFLLMKAVNPQINAFLISGYLVKNDAIDVVKLGLKGVLQKPFSVDTLERKVAEVMQNH